MLKIANTEMDDFYWEVKLFPQSPKRQWAQINEENLDNSVSMVKTTISQKKKMQKLVLKASPLANASNVDKTTSAMNTYATMVISQNSAISQLTEQVSHIKWRVRKCFTSSIN